jgi:hypothetical protein
MACRRSPALIRKGGSKKQNVLDRLFEEEGSPHVFADARLVTRIGQPGVMET